MKIKRMNSESFQHVSNILILIGVLLTALGGYGSYYFGKKSDKVKDTRVEQNYSVQNEKIDSLLKGNEELKNQLSPFLVQARKLFPNEPDSTALEKLKQQIQQTRDELIKEKNTINSLSADLSIKFSGTWSEEPFPKQLISPVDHEWLVVFEDAQKQAEDIKLFATEIYKFNSLSENTAIFNSRQAVKFGAYPTGNSIQTLDKYDKITFFIPLILYKNLRNSTITIDKIDLSLVLNGKIIRKMEYHNKISAEAAIYNNDKSTAWVVFSISNSGRSIMALFT